MKRFIKKAARILSPRQKHFIKRIIFFLKKQVRRILNLLFFIKRKEWMHKDIDPVELLNSVKPADPKALQAEYVEKELDKLPDKFVLYRIIGNDLYPRHKKGQSRENLRMVLENETELEDCEKRFVVNRIIDNDEESAIIELLNHYERPYLVIPFDPEEYKHYFWDTDCLPRPGYLASEDLEQLNTQDRLRVVAAAYRRKNIYVMNNNGARNTALRDGKKRAKWVLPWDGNCFITPSAWEQIRRDVLSAPYYKYFAVPMTRVIDNTQLLTDDFTPEPVEEPQLIFRADALEEFNEHFCYGRRPKVELFWRLGILGKWNYWKDDPWDQKRRGLSPEARQFGVAGWVARMFSGMEQLEQDNLQSFKQRGRVRVEAIISTLQHVDALVSGASSAILTNFRDAVLEKEARDYSSGKDPALTGLVDQLLIDAGEALKRVPYSVIDKSTLPPSGERKDYWHPAPYWWPDPQKPGGLPYIHRDGERVPGTRMYEPESDKYDRTKLQCVFDDSIILALAWIFTNEIKYVEQGARILKRFFVDSETAMNPHLDYAQVRMGYNNNMGSNSGIIEMKDLYYYLDAVRFLVRADAIEKETLRQFREWLSRYLEWLLESPQGRNERRADNNHGTYYDLQVASIAAFLEERSLLYETLLRAQSRIPQQFAPDGSQPEELARKTTAHYCCFNFQGWINMAELASRWGVDFWSYSSVDGRSLVQGARWLLSHTGQKWPYPQLDEFDYRRFYPVWFGVPPGSVELPAKAGIPRSKYEVKPRYYPHDGIRPYWNLG